MPKRGGREGNKEGNERNEKKPRKYTAANNKLAIVAGAMAEQGYINEGKGLSETRKAIFSQYPIMGFIKNLEGPKGRTPLMYAARIGDLERFQQLVEAGANVTKEDDMYSVLTYAATGEKDISNKRVKPQHSEIIRYLVQGKGIPVDTRSGTYEGHPESGYTALMIACAYKNVEAVQLLCDLGADVNARSQNGYTPISFTCQFVDEDDYEDLPEEAKRRLHFDGTNKMMIDKLLTHGANINDADHRGSTCLMRLASLGGNSDGLFFLLTRGADPTMLDRNGNSALAYACDSGDAEHINILGHLIDPNAERNRDNNTLLMRMASGDYAKWSSSLKALLDLKDGSGNMMIELEAKNTQGLTALSIAAQAAAVEAVRTLCEAGADVNTRDKTKSTPLIHLMSNLEYLESSGFPVSHEKVLEIVSILLSAGADPTLKNEAQADFIDALYPDTEYYNTLKAKVQELLASHHHAGPGGGGGGRLGGGGGAGTQGGGSRRGTRGKGKKAKAKGKGKTRKARS